MVAFPPVCVFFHLHSEQCRDFGHRVLSISVIGFILSLQSTANMQHDVELHHRLLQTVYLC